MGKKLNLTDNQKDAINVCDHTMLVSAAAGSGKTAVLTQKIIKLITEMNVDVSDLLVVTFTKAAAAELKERISKAIYEALAKEPKNKHLTKQLSLLGKANISTIHSFCFTLIKSNFQLLGLPSSLRLGDEAETGLICDGKLNELIEECYGGLHSKEIPDFEVLAEYIYGSKSESILSLEFKKIYRYFCNYPEGIELLNKCSSALLDASSKPALENMWGEVIRKHIKNYIEYSYSVFNTAINEFDNYELLYEKFRDGFIESANYCSRVLPLIDNASYDELRDLLKGYKVKNLKTMAPEEKDDISEYYRSIRSDFSKMLSTFVKKYFTFSEDSVKKQFETLSDINKKLYQFFKLFEKEYSNEKTKRGILDFNDLERLTLKLLYDDKECKTVSKFALEAQKKFKYIFIDEYQDVNELQDRIFSAVSTPTNRFMVGDIKQSIYGFRGAEPSLFSDYRKTFPVYDKNADNPDGITIYLSDNFRSDQTVIDFSNSIFANLFNNNSGRTPYTAGDVLKCSKEYEPEEKNFNTRIYLVDDSYEGDRVAKEADFVASEIEKLMASGVKGKNIAILLRTKKNGIYFEEALKNHNILSFNQETRSIFDNDAVLLMVCLLNAIDNPSRDVYLAGVLKSPIFNFTLSELTDIRTKYKYGSLYSILKKYADEYDSSKAKYALEKLSEWRLYAEGCPVDKLIRHIYNETHIVELLSGKMDSSEDVERQANLLMLYEYARKFENGSFKGLYNFILYLDEALEKKTELSDAKLVSDGENVVKIMTIHNSKGLEFETVFVSDCGHEFNKEDEKKMYILRKELGLTLTLLDTTSFGKIKTLARHAAELLKDEDDLDEHLRVLYVALTRAKKHLIITSSAKKANKLVEKISRPESAVSKHQLLSCNSLIDYILWGILKSDYKDYTLEYIGVEEKNEEANPVFDKECAEESAVDTGDESVNRVSDNIEEKQYDRALVDKYLKEIEEKLSNDYALVDSTNMPSKLSVSKLYPGVLDEDAADTSESVPSMYVKPRFLSPEKQKADGAERGTATHIFMQFCNFERVTKNGVESELKYLEDKGFIDKRNASLVNIEKVKSFFESDLYNELLQAKNIWREKRFNIKLPASEFVTEPQRKILLESEKVLVQGVIDLLFETNDGRLILADYKTDYFSESDIKSGKAEKVLIDRHKTQLFYYAEACKRLLGRKVDSVLIYSFSLEKTVKIL